MGWREDRREDTAARAEQARQDALAGAQVEQIRARTQMEATQAQTAQQVEIERQHRADRQAQRAMAREMRRARWAAVRGWAAARVVDLMIYPLAVVSAVMAIPAMAAFGHHVYGSGAGYALPVITELGMWAFAFAVHLTRHRVERDGVDRPVWALQVGVWSFAAVAAGLNFVHGFAAPPVGLSPFVAGLVMAVASVAGVMAHQLVTAAPRRGRSDRETARIERRAAAKVARVRRAAVRSAVAAIDPDGSARLLFSTGHFQLTRSRIAPWRRGRLASIAVPGLPVTPVLDTEWPDLDRELAALLNRADPPPNPTGAAGGFGMGGGLATLDPGTPHHYASGLDDQQESTPIKGDSTDSDTDDKTAARSATRPRRSSRTPRSTTRPAAQSGQRVSRSIEALRAELAAVIEADPDSIDPTSAESIRRALRCSPARARELRDSHRATDDRTD